jgi:hypothetical protein
LKCVIGIEDCGFSDLKFWLLIAEDHTLPGPHHVINFYPGISALVF